MDRRHFLLGGLGLAAVWQLPAADAQPADTPFDELFYRSGQLNIQAYFYKPKAGGAAPLVIYNHGSRPNERHSMPFRTIGKLYSEAGFAVLVPERRGYGKSDGQQYSAAVGNDVGQTLISRLRAETEDVFAALEFAGNLGGVDRSRAGVAGWSLGGIITMFAIAHGRFRAGLNQAGGALLWNRSPALQDALVGAARNAKAPVMLMVAENDRTTDSIRKPATAMAAVGRPHEVKIYPPYSAGEASGRGAPGHMLFSPGGVGVWGSDAVSFFRRRLGA